MAKAVSQPQVARKIIGVPLQKGIEKQQDGTMLVRGKFTSDNRDALGDVITREATQAAIPAYREWGNIRYMHLPRPVGKVVRIGTEDGLEWNEVEIRVVDPQAAFEVENGLLAALSVGILIDFEDIELSGEEDGGWIINGYKLAEISLVDHPANYDAKLDLSAMPEEFRTLAREKGIMAALGEYKNLGEIMPRKNKDLEVPQEDALLEQAEASVEEQAEAAVEEHAFEAPVEEEALQETVEEVIREEEISVEDAVTVEDEARIPTPAETAFMDAMKVLTQVTKELEARMKSLEATQQEVPAEAHKTMERSVETVGSPDIIGLQAEVALLKSQIADLTQPAERKGVIATESPDDAAEELSKGMPEVGVHTLREAVKSYLQTRI